MVVSACSRRSDSWLIACRATRRVKSHRRQALYMYWQESGSPARKAQGGREGGGSSKWQTCPFPSAVQKLSSFFPTLDDTGIMAANNAAAPAAAKPPTKAAPKKRAGIANLACLNCRRRRIRCVSTPGQSCEHCTNSKVQCEWASEDRRRETVNDLRQRLAQLEKQQQAQQDQRHSIQAVSSAAADPQDGAPKKRRLSSPQSGQSQHLQQSLSSEEQRSDIDSPVRPENLDTFALDDNGTIRAFPPLSVHGLSTGVVHTSRTKGSSPGSLQNILASPSQSVGGQQLPDLPYNFMAPAAAHITHLPIGTDIRVVDHLLHTYFCWFHTAFPILSLKAFEESFRGEGQYYSPLLLNVRRSSFHPSDRADTNVQALLAIASHLSDWAV